MHTPTHPPTADSFDKASLIISAQKEGIQAKLEDAEIHEGWDTVVLSTVDGWILRFPRTDEIDTTREQRLLEALAAKIDVEIPQIEYLGSSVSLEVYRRINGYHLNLDDYKIASRDQRSRVSRSIARTLQQFHALDVNALVTKIGLKPSDPHHLIDPIVQNWRTISPSIRLPLSRLIERFEDRWCNAIPISHVIHNDFHLENMSFSAPCGVMTGLWDFSCVELGEPTYDFRYLSVDAPDLCLEIISAYEFEGGVEIDLEAARLAGTIETISDDLVLQRKVNESLLRSVDARSSPH